jgi:hypothetical protein
MTRWILCLYLFALAPTASVADEPPRVLKPIGHLPESIREASGLCKSRQHAGVFWTHSDSGNPPLLFAITRAGKLLATYRVRGTLNLDWESIETDDQGRLYLADVGNNLPRGPLKVRWIDIVKEPDPRAVPAKAPPNDATSGEESQLLEIEVERRVHFAFPDQPFDVEAVVSTKDQLILFAKVHEGPAPIFSLPLKNEDSAKTPGAAKSRGAIELKPLAERLKARRITGAALSPQQDRLAVCSYDYVRVIELTRDDPWQRLDECPSRVIRFAPTQVEGCEWDGDDLLLVSEDRDVYSLKFPRK